MMTVEKDPLDFDLYPRVFLLTKKWMDVGTGRVDKD